MGGLPWVSMVTSQQEHDWVLKEFKHGKAPVLIATDVASRGLDVEDVKFVNS